LLLTIAALVLIIYFLFPFLDGVILGAVFAYVAGPSGTNSVGKAWFPRGLHLHSCAHLSHPRPGMVEVANQIIILAHNQEALRVALGALIQQGTADLPLVVKDLLAGSLENAVGIIAPIAASIPVFHIGRVVSLGIINLIVSIPVCYFVLVDGDSFVELLITLLPERDVDAYRRYITRIDRILSGIFIGAIYTSILGSIIAVSIFYAFGLPRPFALASIVFVAGIVPFLTAWVVIVPVALYKYVTVGMGGAVTFFLISSALIYLPTELLIRPYLVSSRSAMHPLLVMLSFLGGALVAGIGGFFLAPALMGVIVGIYQVRREEMAARKDKIP